MFKEKDFIRICKLENEEEKEYDACNLTNPDTEKWEYLGRGKVIFINGIRQNFKTIDNFWRRK